MDGAGRDAELSYRQPPRGAAGTHDAAEGLAVPPDAGERRRLIALAERYVAAQHLVPPLSTDDLQACADELVASAGVEGRCRGFLMVLISNAVWRDSVAAVPYERRTLLLPPCLRSTGHCRAEFDEFGLLCLGCGHCLIGELQTRAEQLGYAVVVAEGTSIVATLIESGLIDAVIGVSCMASLKRAFPYMAANAIPGVAIPLLYDGCRDTAVDVEWLGGALDLSSDVTAAARVDLDKLRAEVEGCFTMERLREILGADGSDTERIGVSWLAKSGKRWRPLLTVSTFNAVRGAGRGGVAEEITKPAVAVECFHKASLIHDDIEDDDDWRYGERTVHKAHGIPAALNAGDFLVDEGYRLITECDAPPERKAQMLRVAAEGHRSLCLGQGEELCWVRRPAPLSSARTLDVFRLKTAPAFEVALRLGAICGGAGEEVHAVLKSFSETLGVAYQIRDDLLDFLAAEDSDDVKAMRPSLVLALAYESAKGPARELLDAAWRGGMGRDGRADEIRRAIAELGIEARARQMLEEHKTAALRSLRPLTNVQLKTLLYRIVNRILGGP